MKKDWSRYWVIGLLVVLFLLLKMSLPFIVNDDANLYLYFGKLVSEGVVPYRDFRIGHPPLMFFSAGLLFKAFGASLMVGRMVPALSGVGILVFSYLIGEKMKKGLGNAAAVLLFLSPHFQTLTNSMLGASLNLVLLLASLYYLMGKRDFLSGVLFVLAGLARYSAFPFFLVLLGYVLWKKRYGFFYGVGAMAPVVLGLLLIPHFFEYTILNMFARNVFQTSKMAGFFVFFIVQKWVVGLGLLGAGLILLEKVKNEGLQLAMVLCASVLLVLALNEVRYWYIYYSLPFFCILGAYFFDYVRKQAPKSVWWAVVGIMGFVVFIGFIPVLGYQDSIIVEEILGPKVTPGMVVYDVSSPMGAYMAMKYGVNIPPDLVDNNAIGLSSGHVSVQEVLGLLGESRPVYIIDYREDERTTYWMRTDIMAFVDENYQPLAEGVDQDTGNSLVIWERR